MLDMITLIIVGAGVLQLPLIMDVLQQLFPNSPVGRAVTRVMRIILMTAMIFSVTAAVYMNLTLLLKEHVNGYQNLLPADQSTIGYWMQPSVLLHTIFSIWVFVSLLNHFYDAAAKPASRILKSHVSSTSLKTVPEDDDSERICSQCNVPKLLRTHHCRICNVCVELMDHHCVVGGTKISMADHTSRAVKDVQVGDQVLGYSGADGGRLVPRLVTANVKTANRECVKLTFLDGREIICTPDHRIMKEDGTWCEAGQLKLQEKVRIEGTGAGQPLSAMPLTDVRKVENQDVYDLTVPVVDENVKDEDELAALQDAEASFVAEGAVVHNCPFTGNCVGLMSFRPFYLWVCYGFIGITYACFMSMWSFKYCWWDSIGPRGVNPELKAFARAEWTAQRGEMCARLGKGAYLFLPAFFGWLSTLFIFVFQTLLIRADMTTIEYLKGLTQFRLRIEAPEEVAQDDRARQEKSKRRKQVDQSSPCGDHEDDDFNDMDDHGHSVSLLESGSPVGDRNSLGSSLSPSAVSRSFSYNPHKSFRLLIFQNLPVWTVLVPPSLLRWHRKSKGNPAKPLRRD